MNTVNRIFIPMVLIGLITAGIIWACGENPAILAEAFSNTFFSPFGLGYTIYYATPLIFTGLSVALCFHAGLFNIGAEGQLLWGSIAIVAVSHHFSQLPVFLAIPLGIILAALAGALWGLIPGYLKAYRGSHEVVVTILLNFIATTWVGYLILYPLKNPNTQSAETEIISSTYFIPKFSNAFSWFGTELFRTTPANLSFFIALFCALLAHLILYRSALGYEWRAMGTNFTAARFAGIRTRTQTLCLFVISGALAGLVGVNEVMGSEHKVIEGFSPGYGFSGIAVALVAENNPLGIIASAFLFGGLQTFARELEFLSDNISKDISIVLQAILLIFIACRPWLAKRLLKQRGESHD